MTMKKNSVETEKIEGGLWVREGFARGPEPERPLVSVVTVCQNDEKHLEQTIESVLGQTYGDIECIVVDRGSSDGTLDILRKYDKDISYWVSEQDDGPYGAMNKGISLATGGLVGIIDGGDWYFPYTAEAAVEASSEDPEARVFFGPLYVTDEEGVLECVWEGSEQGIEHRSQVNLATCFVRSAVYDDYRFNTKYRLLADYDLMLRLHLAGMRFHRVDRPLAWHRAGARSPGYYRSGAESYDIRWGNDLLTPWQYVGGRLALAFEAPLVKLRRVVAGGAYREIYELRRGSGCLYADNLALKDELAAASEHVARVDAALSERDAEVARLDAEVARLSLALEASSAESSVSGYFRRLMGRNR